jgi:hypothetical protein
MSALLLAVLGNVCLIQYLELPPIGWQLFILGSSESDSTAFSSFLVTYATRLLAEALSLRFNHEGFCDELYVHRKTPRVRPIHGLSQPF